MKYYKISNVENKTEFIAKMMMNLMSGKYIWDEKTGELNAKHKKGYNSYNIDKISYDVHPTVGVVVIMQNNRVIRADSINAVYNQLHQQVQVKPIVGEENTDHYVVVSKKNPTTVSYHGMNNTVMRKPGNKLGENINFTWLFCDSFYNGMPFCIPDLTPYQGQIKEELMYLSLSTLIFDVNDMVTLPHAISSPNLPMSKDYRVLSSGNIYNKTINYSLKYGVHMEIANQYFKVLGNNKISQPIFWMKWEDINPMCLKKSSLGFEQQLAGDLLQPYKGDAPTCILTGMPIYEDCYVLDIYEYKKNIEIEESELLPTDEVVRKPLTKKGDNPKLVVKRSVRNEKPLHVLVSAVAMHGYNKYETAVDALIRNMEIKCIIYRSFCPVTCYDVIEKIKGPDCYKRILHGLNLGAKYKQQNMLEARDISPSNSRIILLGQISQESIFNNSTSLLSKFQMYNW